LFPFRRRKFPPDTDWVASGYPPSLIMRRRVRGKWQERAATEEESARFLRIEAEFLSKQREGGKRSSSPFKDEGANAPHRDPEKR